MAFSRFRVGPTKGLALAELEEVPNLLVVVGPNGSGKSTLLYELQRNRATLAEAGTRVIYLNPYRPWRRTTFGTAFLYNLPYSYRQLLELDNFPGFQNYQPPGFVHSGLARSPDNIDDAQSLVKFAIAKLENRRYRLIAEEYDRRGGSIPEGSVPNAFEPLRELIATLLPHLRFSRVDTSNDATLQVFFEKLDSPTRTFVELDDLSSGEKAILQLFLPFIEDQIQQRLTGREDSADEAKPVAIIDEPELHLHPALQVALIAYLRQLAEEGKAQFIVATHATAMMDALEDDELYLLAPPALVGDGNQLIKVAASAERLDAIRHITGSTYVVTRCRPIVFTEGEPAAKSRDVTDTRLVETLIPESRGWVLVPAHGRSQAIRGATDLREPSLTHLPGMSVFALVDRDQSEAATPDHVVEWPVCMIENLLLDIDGLWEVVEPVRERVGLQSKTELRDVFAGYAAERIEREIELRVQRRVPAFRTTLLIRRLDDVEHLEARAMEAARAHVAGLGGEEAVRLLIDDAAKAVQKVLTEGRALEAFHGKELLRRFYDEYGKRGGWSYQTFCYQAAMAARSRPRLRELVEGPVRTIRQFVPKGLVEALEEAEALLASAETPHPDAAEVLAAVRDARARWQAGEEDTQDRALLRDRISAVAHALRQTGNAPVQQRLLAEAVAFGAS